MKSEIADHVGGCEADPEFLALISFNAAFMFCELL